jgi:putative ABC transport system ATP-binding protein
MVIEVEALTYAYPRSDRAVLDIEGLAIRRGEHVFLFGPSGSGKTTLLGLLAGILTATSGEVRVLGRSLASLSGPQRDRFRGAHIGYVFQLFNLVPYLDVERNIRLPLAISPERAERAAADADGLRRIATELGIAPLLGRAVTNLSVGQQQRVAAARALIGAPEILIADEPTSALDADTRAAFLRTLFACAERVGSTIVFVSHDLGLRDLFPRAVALREINRVAATADAGAGRVP